MALVEPPKLSYGPVLLTLVSGSEISVRLDIGDGVGIDVVVPVEHQVIRREGSPIVPGDIVIQVEGIGPSVF